MKISNNIKTGIAIVVAGGIMANVYLKCEEEIGKKLFCDQYTYLKDEPRDVQKQAVAKYFGKVHPENEERLYHKFVDWVEDCE